MLYHVYTYRNQGDEDVVVYEELQETHPAPPSTERMRDAHLDGKRKHPEPPLPFQAPLEQDWKQGHRLVAVAQGGTFAAGPAT